MSDWDLSWAKSSIVWGPILKRPVTSPHSLNLAQSWIWTLGDLTFPKPNSGFESSWLLWKYLSKTKSSVHKRLQINCGCWTYDQILRTHPWVIFVFFKTAPLSFKACFHPSHSFSFASLHSSQHHFLQSLSMPHPMVSPKPFFCTQLSDKAELWLGHSALYAWALAKQIRGFLLVSPSLESAKKFNSKLRRSSFGCH